MFNQLKTITMIKNYLADLHELQNKEFEMEAIWLEKSLQTPSGKHFRLTRDMEVKIENGSLVDCTENPTHKIIGCSGTITSSKLTLILTDLKTNEPLTLNLK